jgi:hypothetical protein
MKPKKLVKPAKMIKSLRLREEPIKTTKLSNKPERPLLTTNPPKPTEEPKQLKKSSTMNQPKPIPTKETPKTVEEPKKPEKVSNSFLQIPKEESLNYKFTGLGHLLYKNHEYFRAFTRGKTFTTIFKCIEHKTTAKCAVVLKAQGKYLISISEVHNHD